MTASLHSTAPSHARVLLVEDEPTLARVFTHVLSNAGYVVNCCTDSREALQRFRAAPNTVHVVVSDVTMPGLSGVQLAGALHEIRPDLPIILMTGGSTLSRERVRALGVAEMLQKPVGIEDLLGAVGSVFEGRQLEV